MRVLTSSSYIGGPRMSFSAWKSMRIGISGGRAKSAVSPMASGFAASSTCSLHPKRNTYVQVPRELVGKCNRRHSDYRAPVPYALTGTDRLHLSQGEKSSFKALTGVFTSASTWLLSLPLTRGRLAIFFSHINSH